MTADDSPHAEIPIKKQYNYQLSSGPFDYPTYFLFCLLLAFFITHKIGQANYLFVTSDVALNLRKKKPRSVTIV